MRKTTHKAIIIAALVIFSLLVLAVGAGLVLWWLELQRYREFMDWWDQV